MLSQRLEESIDAGAGSEAVGGGLNMDRSPIDEDVVVRGGAMAITPR